jgi:hypothetical protein
MWRDGNVITAKLSAVDHNADCVGLDHRRRQTWWEEWCVLTYDFIYSRTFFNTSLPCVGIATNRDTCFTQFLDRRISQRRSKGTLPENNILRCFKGMWWYRIGDLFADYALRSKYYNFLVLLLEGGIKSLHFTTKTFVPSLTATGEQTYV